MRNPVKRLLHWADEHDARARQDLADAIGIPVAEVEAASFRARTEMVSAQRAHKSLAQFRVDKATQDAAKEVAKAAEKAKAADARRLKPAKDAGLSYDLYGEWRSAVVEAKRNHITVKEKDLLVLYQAVASNSTVIVRNYLQLFGGAKHARTAFQWEANILARHGYTPTTQTFAANNVLTGKAVGSGELIVSYTKARS